MLASRLCSLCRGITAEALTSKAGYTHAARLEPGCDLYEKLELDDVPDYDWDSDNDPDDNNSGYSKWDLRLGIIVREQDPKISCLNLSSEI